MYPPAPSQQNPTQEREERDDLRATYESEMAFKRKEENARRDARLREREEKRQAMQEAQRLKDAARQAQKEAESKAAAARAAAQQAAKAQEEKARVEKVKQLRQSIDAQKEKRRASLYTPPAAAVPGKGGASGGSGSKKMSD